MSTDFETRARAEAERFATHDVGDWSSLKFGFLAGARWSREQTIADVLALLRGEDAESGLPRKPYQFDCEKVAASAREWATWLEKRMRGGE